MKSDGYIVIQGFMCNELELKGNDLLVFALIYGFSQDGVSKYCGGRSYIADTFNISLPTVDKALNGLLKRGLICKHSSGDYINTDEYWANLGVVKKLYEGSKETLPYNISNISTNVDKHTTNVVCEPQAIEDEFFVKETTKKPKKNLYQNCVDAINAFTDDLEVREKLIEFLGIRLERKDTPFGIKAFQGTLKKLRSLTESKAECLKIIQQSIDRSYLSFFPLMNRQPYKKKTGKDVEIMTLEGDAVRVSESEKEEMRRLVESGEIEEY